MDTCDKTYSVRWFGPFKSVEEVKDFENSHDNMSFQLYILNGYKPYAKFFDNYYCGQTKRSVYERLTDKNHHINEFKSISAIWIGSISSKEPDNVDINIVEKIMTAQMRVVFGEKFMLNQMNTAFPKYNAYVINIWHTTSGQRMHNYKSATVPSYLPDLIGHEYDTNNCEHQLFSTSKIQWDHVE